MNRNKKRGGIIGVIITAVILIFLVIISNINTGKWSNFTNIITAPINTAQSGITYLKNKLTGNHEFFADVDNLRKENENLKNENNQLQQKLREFEILKAENSTLREYVNLKEKYSEYTTLPAYVIQYDISNYSKVIIINVGKRDGIDVNMPVISEKGLVRLCSFGY